MTQLALGHRRDGGAGVGQSNVVGKGTAQVVTGLDLVFQLRLGEQTFDNLVDTGASQRLASAGDKQRTIGQSADEDAKKTTCIGIKRYLPLARGVWPWCVFHGS